MPQQTNKTGPRATTTDNYAILSLGLAPSSAILPLCEVQAAIGSDFSTSLFWQDLHLVLRLPL